MNTVSFPPFLSTAPSSNPFHMPQLHVKFVIMLKIIVTYTFTIHIYIHIFMYSHNIHIWIYSNIYNNLMTIFNIYLVEYI